MRGGDIRGDSQPCAWGPALTVRHISLGTCRDSPLTSPGSAFTAILRGDSNTPYTPFNTFQQPWMRCLHADLEITGDL